MSDTSELLEALEEAARMAEQGILSADGGQAAVEIRSLIPSQFRGERLRSQRQEMLDLLKRVVAVLDAEVFNELAADNLLRDARALVERFDK